MFPPKLREGNEIRVVAPSSSLTIISDENKRAALNRLRSLGFTVTFSKNAKEMDESGSSSIESRVKDLHEAFSDANVKGILAVIGGYNVNQILKYLDYDLIRNNPKVLCGYSDITAMSNAIYEKTGLVNYSGPVFANFGMMKGFEHTLEYFKKCLMSEEPFEIVPSKEWSDDRWYIDQDRRNFMKNSGPYIINDGRAEGTIIGGNLCTLNLLQGTEFMPSMRDTIVFLEDDDMEGKLTYSNFDRNLQSLLHLPDAQHMKGVVIGRFQKESEMNREKLVKIIRTKKELGDIPVIADVDFGHSSPMATFPIGGIARVSAKNNQTKLEIVRH